MVSHVITVDHNNDFWRPGVKTFGMHGTQVGPYYYYYYYYYYMCLMAFFQDNLAKPAPER